MTLKYFLGPMQSESTTLKLFLGVRVAEIHSEWPVKWWKYVPTKLNPAEDLSRDVKVGKIKESWFNGPELLKSPSRIGLDKIS